MKYIFFKFNVFQFLLLCSMGIIFNPVCSAKELQKSSIPVKPDKAWVDEVIKNAKNLKDSDPGKGIEYAKQATKIADSLNYREGSINARILFAACLQATEKNDSAKIILNDLLDKYGSRLRNPEFIDFWVSRGITYYELGSYDTAMSNYEIAFKIVPNGTEMNEITASIYTNRANVYGMRGEYASAIDDYMKVAKYFEKSNMQAPLAQIYINIGAELRNLKEFSKSIEYYKKGVVINQKVGNNRGLAQCYANIGVSYVEMDSVKMAIEFYEKSMEIAEKINNPLFIAQNLLNLGNIYEGEGDYEKAIQSFKRSMQICRDAGINYGVMLNLLNLGHSNWLAKKFDSSNEYYQEALKMSRDMKLPKEEYQVLERLSKLNEDQQNFKEAYQNHKQFYVLKDSIQSAEKNKYILELEKKYETEKKELEIAGLEKEGLTQRYIIAILIAAALLLLIFIQRTYLKNKITKRDYLIVQQKSVMLQSKIESKNRELGNIGIQLVEMQKHLWQTNDKIKAIINKSAHKNHPTLQEILNWLKSNYIKRSLLTDFENQLADSNKDFYSSLLAGFPDLTPTELKICAMLRLNLSSKEIAVLLTRSVRTIDFTRNSIRKKLKLGIQDNLSTFLLSVN